MRQDQKIMATYGMLLRNGTRRPSIDGFGRRRDSAIRVPGGEKYKKHLAIGTQKQQLIGRD
jgi:hypothetical protein